MLIGTEIVRFILPTSILLTRMMRFLRQVRYLKINTTAPYGLSGVMRGMYGTKAAAHKQHASAAHLAQLCKNTHDAHSRGLTSRVFPAMI